MQLKLIQKYIGAFKAYLKAQKSIPFEYIWESQVLFQKHWDIEAPDLKAMYDASLQNSKTRRLWSREHYAPKAMMLKFIDLQPAYVLQIFGDLFNEEKSIDGRVSRFVFYCDQLLQEYKAAHPTSIENNHYHDDDYQMVSLYLAFRYPERYTYYDRTAFVKLLQRIGAKNVSNTNDFERFVKVMKTISTFLLKEEDLLRIHRERFKRSPFQPLSSLLIVYEFYQFVAKEPILVT